MVKNRDIEVALAHEFWCCKRQFDSFLFHAALLPISPTKQHRLEAFTAYGNFIRHLYTFYEGIIKFRNAELIAGLKTHEVGIKISSLMNLEVEKLIRNKVFVYNSDPTLDKREIKHFTAHEVPDQFGKDFRQMRNRFSHAEITRVSKTDLTLFYFFQQYHKYLLLMYQSCAFTWNIEDIERYDWQEIDEFFNILNKQAKDRQPNER
jgi:hypothetical protein